MSGAANIDELIRRVEGASGPDRDLDREIARLQGLRIVDEGHPIGCVCYDANGGAIALPAYTRSLDAAMTLAEDADLSELLNEAMEETGIRGWVSGDYRGALTRNFVAAALRALASKPAEGEGL